MNPPSSAPSFLLLYVANPPASAAFYAGLLGAPIVESSPNFAMLPLAGGLMLGLWAKHDVAPAASLTGGGAEIGFAEASDEAVRARHADWAARGLSIIQEPVKMDFGFTFTAADPDGHRLRVFAPGAQ